MHEGEERDAAPTTKFFPELCGQFGKSPDDDDLDGGDLRSPDPLFTHLLVMKSVRDFSELAPTAEDHIHKRSDDVSEPQLPSSTKLKRYGHNCVHLICDIDLGNC